MARSIEEKAAWLARMRGLAKRLKGMSDDKRRALAARMPIVTCEGHILSVHNNCALIFQAGTTTVTMVGGFRQWQKVGHAVTKGEHAVGYIMVPMVRRNGNDSDGGEEVTEEVRFRWVPVFDITQTHEVATAAEAAA